MSIFLAFILMPIPFKSYIFALSEINFPSDPQSMITQKMISVKLDVDQLEKLDELCSKIGCNRNKMINFAVMQCVLYLSDFKFCLLTDAYKRALSALDN